MSDSLFRRVIVPVANEEDARATARALRQHAEDISGTVIAVHVIEKAGGAPDAASVEQRELDAQEMFDVVADELADLDVELQSEYLYGTDVGETIVDGAHDLGGTAIIFTPRGGSRWMRLLSGDVMTTLVTESDIPILVLPDRPVDTET